MRRRLEASDEVVILGLGDTASGDEGIGAWAVEGLSADYVLPPNVLVVVAPAPDLDVLDALEDAAYLVAVDVVYAEAEPGSVFVVPLEEYARPPDLPESLHEERLLSSLGAIELLAERPAGVLLAVQAGGLATGQGLSAALRDRLPEIVAAIVAELERVGIAVARRMV